MTMKVHFEKALAALEQLMGENAMRAQTAVNSAVRAMEQGDTSLADAVIQGDSAIDLAENVIEERGNPTFRRHHAALRRPRGLQCSPPDPRRALSPRLPLVW